MKMLRIGLALVGLGVGGCSNVVGGAGDTNPNAPPKPSVTTDKVDLLLVIDNSASMADKQAVLGTSIHRLLDGLVNPPCVDDAGALASQPPSASANCPAGSHRRFQPVRSIHLGVISSSLGGLGADQCDEAAGSENDDGGQLLDRTAAGHVSTYLDYGYLAFDPDAALSPPGDVDYDHFVSTTVDLVEGVGQMGCGYEMPLEAAYRFLVDPSPYAEILKSDGSVLAPTYEQGVNNEILEERQRFLRPDSLVGVVLLTDENDCSTKVGGQAYAVLNTANFFEASTVCATDPLASCCYSCGMSPPDGCAPDPACDGGPQYPWDSGNLRCFHQKQRYGIDLLYPIERYVNAFSVPLIDPDSDDLAGPNATTPNPLFTGGRAASLVVMAGIVGVPWQLVAEDPANPSAGFQTSSELIERGTWDKILGDPAAWVNAADPSMIESIAERPGVDPAFNGGDRSTESNDLQYACIFPLAAAIPDGPDCSPAAPPENPVCEGSTQVAAKAYPGLRELSVLKGLGDQGVVASVCESSFTAPPDAPMGPSAGYYRAMNAMVDRMAASLVRSE